MVEGRAAAERCPCQEGCMHRRACGSGLLGGGALAFLLAALGCGTEPEALPPETATSAGAEQPGWGRGEGMKVEGILGTIPQLRIEEVLEAKLPEFQRCFFEGTGKIASLGGHMKFYFHV